MVSTAYVPQRGDLIWLNFDPRTGHEQSGQRPAIVLSPGKYNSKTGLLLACPITSKVKGYPFEVALQGKKIEGVVLSDQVRTLDWKSRRARLIEKVPEETFTAVQEKLLVLLQ
ncbi:MAG: endoribonuclease MazF [Spirochaetaceae bacterium]|nr:endoribonuclease MazF [Spirochaetaceae bacterium]MCF7951758.1 endoribonuclease MazF [Spirochaetaceae bacterium]